MKYPCTPTLDLIGMEKKHKGKYTTVHIPTVLAQIIDQVIENEECAYSSRSEFIKDAVRRFLEYYGYRPTIDRQTKPPEIHSEIPQFSRSR